MQPPPERRAPRRGIGHRRLDPAAVAVVPPLAIVCTAHRPLRTLLRAVQLQRAEIKLRVLRCWEERAQLSGRRAVVTLEVIGR